MNKKNFSGIKNNNPLPNPNEMEIPDDIGSLLDEYIESASSMLDELEQATLEYEADKNRPENAATIKRILHKIKGESGMVGIEDMAEFCHQAESAFEELAEDERPDMLLRFKDWISTAIFSLTS
ncbi:MAG: Hpt domain-containing protein [Planctomycetes bacterium]|nr:Hpt domain-containing protein [Planctomycetota bacterium]MBL7145787.1 Hpt domain-containing protein [Phycisphaerae bacterium]